MNATAQIPALSVSDVNRYIKALFVQDDVLSSVTVRGEISNLKPHSTGHLYFTLKDESSEIAAVMFRSDAARMQFAPANGMRVVIHGTVDVFEKSGRYQVYARTMMADGIGALALAYEKLKKQLESEGLFAPERKRPLPKFPSCVGVITAPTGAAIRDILNVTGRRYPAAKILLYPSLVQGPDAPANLLAGLEYLNADQSCDVIILGRGGGSMEDLWAFNDEALVRAVAASEIPVISAVGHEVDFTLCDFAADYRAPTPSAAAEIAVPDRAVLARQIGNVETHLERRMLGVIGEKKNLLLTREQALSLRSPEAKLERMRQQVQHDRATLDRLAQQVLERRTEQLRRAAERLSALNPLSVLGRGYSVLKDEMGRVVGRADGLRQRQRVEIVLADGSAMARIEEICLKVKETKGEPT